MPYVVSLWTLQRCRKKLRVTLKICFRWECSPSMLIFYLHGTVCDSCIWWPFSRWTQCLNPNTSILSCRVACLGKTLTSHWRLAWASQTVAEAAYHATPMICEGNLHSLQDKGVTCWSSSMATVGRNSKEPEQSSSQELQLAHVQVPCPRQLCSNHPAIRDYWFIYNANCKYNSHWNIEWQ